MNRSGWWTILRDYWWLGGVLLALASTVSLWAAMPKRLDKVEQRNDYQEKEITELKVISAKIEGYTEALTKLQQRFLTEDMEKREEDAPAEEDALTPIEVWEDPDDADNWIYDVGGKRWCSDGRTSWRWHPRRHCRR